MRVEYSGCRHTLFPHHLFHRTPEAGLPQVTVVPLRISLGPFREHEGSVRRKLEFPRI